MKGKKQKEDQKKKQDADGLRRDRNREGKRIAERIAERKKQRIAGKK